MDQEFFRDHCVKEYDSKRDKIAAKMSSDIEAANRMVRRGNNTHSVLGRKISSVPESVIQHATIACGGGKEGRREAETEYIKHLQKRNILEKPRYEKRSNFVGYGS